MIKNKITLKHNEEPFKHKFKRYLKFKDLNEGQYESKSHKEIEKLQIR